MHRRSQPNIFPAVISFSALSEEVFSEKIHTPPTSGICEHDAFFWALVSDCQISFSSHDAHAKFEHCAISIAVSCNLSQCHPNVHLGGGIELGQEVELRTRSPCHDTRQTTTEYVKGERKSKTDREHHQHNSKFCSVVLLYTHFQADVAIDELFLLRVCT